jgi:hypothetical protein
MEQRFSNNSLDLETLREFCKREGDPARWLAFVESGCFKYVTHGISNDREHIMWFSFEGEFVVDYPTYYGIKQNFDGCQLLQEDDGCFPTCQAE